MRIRRAELGQAPWRRSGGGGTARVSLVIGFAARLLAQACRLLESGLRTSDIENSEVLPMQIKVGYELVYRELPAKQLDTRV